MNQKGQSTKEMMMDDALNRWMPLELRPLWAWAQAKVKIDRGEGGQELLVVAVLAGMFVLAAIVVAGVIIAKTKTRVNAIPDTDSIPVGP